MKMIARYIVITLVMQPSEWVAKGWFTPWFVNQVGNIVAFFVLVVRTHGGHFLVFLHLFVVFVGSLEGLHQLTVLSAVVFIEFLLFLEGFLVWHWSDAGWMLLEVQICLSHDLLAIQIVDAFIALGTLGSVVGAEAF